MRGQLRAARMLGSQDMVLPFKRRVIPNTSFGTGRICAGYAHRDGCGTILCRYNPGPLCYICTHEARRSEARQMVKAA